MVETLKLLDMAGLESLQVAVNGFDKSPNTFPKSPICIVVVLHFYKGKALINHVPEPPILMQYSSLLSLVKRIETAAPNG